MVVVKAKLCKILEPHRKMQNVFNSVYFESNIKRKDRKIKKTTDSKGREKKKREK